MYKQNTLFSVTHIIRQYSWVSPIIVFLMLWASMVFALHTHHHHDEISDHDSECQICYYASLNNSVVPETFYSSNPVVILSSVTEILTETVLIIAQIRTQEARAPPFIS